MKIAVIGAGISGLTAAQMLNPYFDVTVFEKSRGVGGRISVRRAGPYTFDHGAQYCVPKGTHFKQTMLDHSHVQPWTPKMVRLDKQGVTDVVGPKYVGVPNMNGMVTCLTTGVRIQLQTPVIAMQCVGGQWVLESTQALSLGTYDWVVCAIPPKQAEALLTTAVFQQMQIPVVQMTGCFTVMLGFDHPLTLPFDAAVVVDPAIQWIAVNSAKPQRNQAYSLVVHTHPMDMEQHGHLDPAAHLPSWCARISAYTQCRVDHAVHKATHLWRYAYAPKRSGAKSKVCPLKKIAVCGDWFIESTIESAWTSGRDVAMQLLNTLRTKP